MILTRLRNGITRFLVRTHALSPEDEIGDVIERYAKKHLEQGDIVVLAESPVAITQGRAVPVKTMHPRLSARILWRFVRKVSYGVGLRNPYSMEAAIQECGELRIWFASIFGGFLRLTGRRGDFYRIAGIQARMIDAVGTSPVKPYDKCVLKGPADPEGVVRNLKRRFGVEFAIMDINDIGGSWVVGATSRINRHALEDLMRDNPMGQGTQLTPITVVRAQGTQLLLN
jgi:F420-0:gamma-glutamyl ligase